MFLLLCVSSPFHPPAPTSLRRVGDLETPMHVELNSSLIVLVNIEDDVACGRQAFGVIEQCAADAIASDLRVDSDEVESRLGLPHLVPDARETDHDILELSDPDPARGVRTLRAEPEVAERSRRR